MRGRGKECVRALARIALLAALAGLLLPRAAHAQEHDIAIPAGPVENPIYAPTSNYPLDELYDRWWHEVAACEGIELPAYYVLVRYVQINYAYFDLPHDDPSPPGQVILGHSFIREWQMFIAIRYRFDPEIVMHEMAHFLLYWAHIANGGHPAKYFDGHCGFHQLYSRPASSASTR